MGDSFFRGTSAEQDARFANKQTQLLKSMKFPKIFDTKVDMSKVELKVVKPWIAEKINAKLGFEDDVLIQYIYGMLEEKSPDPKVMQINLTGFLEAEAAPFMQALWTLLVSAQNEVGGIPTEILEKKKAELKAQMAEQQRIAAQIQLHAPTQRPSIPQHVPQQRVVGKQLGATDEQMASGVMGKLTQQQQPPPVMLAQVPPQMLQHPIVAAAAVAVGDVTLDLAIEGQKRRAARRLTEAANSKTSSGDHHSSGSGRGSRYDDERDSRDKHERDRSRDRRHHHHHRHHHSRDESNDNNDNNNASTDNSSNNKDDSSRRSKKRDNEDAAADGDGKASRKVRVTADADEPRASKQ